MLSKVRQSVRRPLRVVSRGAEAIRLAAGPFRRQFGQLAAVAAPAWWRITRLWRRRKLLSLARTKRPIILFLVPEAGLTPFYASHAILAKTVNEAGYASLMLSCNGLLPICSLKVAMKMSPTDSGNNQNAACQQCRRQALLTGDEYQLTDASVESVLGAQDRKEIARILDENSNAPWKLTHDGIAFGAIAIGDILRSRRLLTISNLTSEDLDLLKAVLFSSLTIYFIVKKLTSRYSIRRIVSFGNYAIWIPSQIFAERRQIAVTHLDHAYNFDIDRRFIGLRSRNSFEDLTAQIECWPQYRQRPIKPVTVETIAEGALYRLRNHGGTTTYSPNWVRRDGAVQEELGLSLDRKTVVAFSSSADEFIAAQAFMQVRGKPYAQGLKPFEDQTAWLRALVDWSGARSDLQLIVRLHPRIAGGRHYSSAASEYFQLRKEFAELPENVAMIWPEEKISSYNLAEIADAAVVAWSTIGLELARFGVPVVAAFPGIGSFPTGGFIAFEESRPRYFRAVEAALDRSASITAITEAFRWTHFMVWSYEVDVSDLIPAHDYGGVPPWRMPKSHNTILRVLVKGEDLIELNMAQLPLNSAAGTSERKAILGAIHRFVVFFMSGIDRPNVRFNGLRPRRDGFVDLEIDGEVFRRYSPLVHRLAKMLNDASVAEMSARVN